MLLKSHKKLSLTLALLAGFALFFFLTKDSAPSFSVMKADAQVVSNIDLNVTHIERVEKYQRYRVTYFNDRNGCMPEYINYYPYSEDRGPQLCPGEETKQRWPNAGEIVTFNAYVNNQGASASGQFHYQWKVDGVTLKSGVAGSIGAGQAATETFLWTWPENLNDHSISFSVDTGNTISERYETNNQITDKTNALSFGIFIGQNVYDSLKNPHGLSNPTSPEDWIQKHVRRFNQLMDQANIGESIRLDKFYITQDIWEEGVEHDATWRETIVDQDSDKWNEDGWWGIQSDYRQNDPNGNPRSAYYNAQEDIDYGMLHEWMHRMGIIDLYRLNVGLSENTIFDKRTNRIGAGCGTEYGWANENQCFDIGRLPSISEDLANNSSPKIGSHSAQALKSNLHKRRGYYGEYLMDLPTSVRVQFVDAQNSPLTNAVVKVYRDQMDPLIGGESTFKSTNLVQTATTDSNGYITLNTLNGVWTNTDPTATGHQLRANPLGVVDEVGRNGIFLFEIDKNGYDYKWLSLFEMNLAYWSGNQDLATFKVTSLLNQSTPPPNINYCSIDGYSNVAPITIEVPRGESVNLTMNYQFVDGWTYAPGYRIHSTILSDGQFPLKAVGQSNEPATYGKGNSGLTVSPVTSTRLFGPTQGSVTYQFFVDNSADVVVGETYKLANLVFMNANFGTGLNCSGEVSVKVVPGQKVMVKGTHVDINGNPLTLPGQRISLNSGQFTELTPAWNIINLNPGSYSIAAQSVSGYSIAFKSCKNCSSPTGSYVMGNSVSASLVNGEDFSNVNFQYLPNDVSWTFSNTNACFKSNSRFNITVAPPSGKTAKLNVVDAVSNSVIYSKDRIKSNTTVTVSGIVAGRSYRTDVIDTATNSVKRATYAVHPGC